VTRRNLIIIHRGPEYQRDFDEIAAKITAHDRNITTYQLPAGLRAELPGGIWEHPSLTVSLVSKFRIPIMRGTILKNQSIGKLAQQDIFRSHGISTPPALPFRFGMKLDPILFGEFVVLKPGDLRLTSTGESIRLMRRRRAESLTFSGLDTRHPLRADPDSYLVQRFVDTGEFIKYNRVTSFFGVPLWCNEAIAATPRPSLASSDDVLERVSVANLSLERRLYRFHSDADMLSIARRVHAALPDVPLLGIDILREERSGKLFVLECNAGGNGWHFSSEMAQSFRNEIAEAHGYIGAEAESAGRRILMEQFDAFSGVAEVLVRKTHELAV
jgi:hypothetical protein